MKTDNTNFLERRLDSENDRTADEETDGNYNIIIVIGLVLGLLVMAGVASILIKIIKDKIIKGKTETLEFNENYGNLSPEQYYEEEKKSVVVHLNDYY